jgi:hypothetical protein
MKCVALQKRQPAGTGRRSPGAFGLIPGEEARMDSDRKEL